MNSKNEDYKKLLISFGVSTLKIRYQTLYIVKDQDRDRARIFADVLVHNLTQDEYYKPLGQVINELAKKKYWISKIETNNETLLCVATASYYDIKRFKSLEEQQSAEAADEEPINLNSIKNDTLNTLTNANDVLKIALELFPTLDTKVEHDDEYHTTFQYHVVENAILRANGWECLRIVDDRVESIEDDEWLESNKIKLNEQFPWIQREFNPSRNLLEYGLKFVTLGPGKRSSVTERQRMLSKALRLRTREANNRVSKSDMGHLFCIAVLLISLINSKTLT